MIAWILGFMCSNQGLIVIIMIKCYLNATLSIIGHVLFMNFFYKYHCFLLAYPYLFVCVFVACAMIISHVCYTRADDNADVFSMKYIDERLG